MVTTPDGILRLKNQEITDKLLPPIFTKIDQFEGQVIPDDYTTANSAINARAQRSSLHNKAVLECYPPRLGFDYDNRKQKRKLQQLESDLQQSKEKLKHQLQTFLSQWLAQHPEEEFSQSRLQTIQKISDILLGGVQQFSEQTFLWTLNYALTATSPQAKGDFLLIVGMGGDSVPPIDIEGYLLQPLSVLSQLQNLQQQGAIRILPKLALTFSATCAAIENHIDKNGDRINPNQLLYNSRTSIQRLHAFIAGFYPSLAERVLFLEFPAYKAISLARVAFAVLWQQIPIPRESLNKWFAIKGDVQDAEEQAQDLLYQVLGDYNAYPSRHLVSNGILSEAHTLRYGSSRTEPMFHLAASSLLPLVQQQGGDLLQQIKAAALQVIEARHSQANPKANCSLFLRDWSAIEVRLESQFSNLPPEGKIHAQIGMWGVHACYFKHPLEPSLKQVVAARRYSAKKLRQNHQSQKAALMEKTFAQVVEAVGRDNYFNHLAFWSEQYLPKIDDETLDKHLQRQQEQLHSLLLPTGAARQLLNYYF